MGKFKKETPKTIDEKTTAAMPKVAVIDEKGEIVFNEESNTILLWCCKPKGIKVAIHGTVTLPLLEALKENANNVFDEFIENFKKGENK